MKKLFYTIALPLFLFVSACDNETQTVENNSNAMPEGWVEIDLTQPGMHYGLPMLINIPDENIAKGVAEVKEGPSGGTQLKAGSDFNIEIIPGPLSIAEKKEEVTSNPIFKVTFIQEEPDMIFYKSEIEGTEISQYHFYTIKEIGSGKYGIEDVKEDEYSETGIKRMIEAAKSLRSKSQN